MKMATGIPITGREKRLLLGGMASIVLVCVLGGVAIFSAGSHRAASTPPPAQPISNGSLAPEVPSESGSLTQPTAAGPEAFPEFIVQIIAYADQGGTKVPVWMGTGVIVSTDGLILTTNEIVRPGKPFTVSDLVIAMADEDGQTPQPAYYADIVQANKNMDLAILRIARDMDLQEIDRETAKFPAAPLGNSDYLDENDSLHLVGYDAERSQAILRQTVGVKGFQAVTGVSQRAFVMLSESISGVFNGAAALDANGEVVGIATSMMYAGEDQMRDCRPLYDTNRDGETDAEDRCIPGGKRIQAVRPLRLAKPILDAANRGEATIVRERGSLVDLPANGKLLFGDSFLNSSGGWLSINEEGMRASVTGGQFQVGISEPYSFLAAGISRPFGDVKIEAVARLLASTSSSDYGLICRYQDDDNYYALEVSEDGYFSIWKRQGGTLIPLLDWTESDVLRNGGQALRLTATCIGNSLSLIVGERMLGQAEDDSFPSGGIGLIAGTWEAGGLDIAFDDVVVRSAGSQPERPLEILYQDDYSDIESGWLADMGAQYFDGGLRLFVAGRQVYKWSRTQNSFLDVRIEADAEKLGGPENNEFGLLCRYQPATKEFYFFNISSDGFAAIGYFNGSYSTILTGKGSFLPASSILQGDSINRIRADCIGSVLTLYVNGTQVLDLVDETLKEEGDIGVIVGTFNAGGADILFDNFVAYKP